MTAGIIVPPSGRAPAMPNQASPGVLLPSIPVISDTNNPTASLASLPAAVALERTPCVIVQGRDEIKCVKNNYITRRN